ncbi:MAG: alpha/beta hydrolase [Acidimicrobiia bacterium]|nr:alpha/beta hydrolase [Acidimicrobiia bacterium]
MMGGTLRRGERAPTGGLASDLHARNAYRRGPEAAGRIRCRALLVSGSLDIMTPSRAAAPLRERLAGLQEVTIEGAGHIMMVEQPDPVIDAIAGFLEDPAPR